MLRDPQSVRIEISDARFDATMEAIRAWLRREAAQVAEFKVGPSQRGFEIELGFRTDADAERFRQDFATETANLC